MQRHYSLKLTFLFVAIFILANNFVFYPGNIFSWDVFGYYIYLPLKFIYGTLNLENLSVAAQIVAKYQNTATLYQFVQLPDGNFIIKYSMGLSYFYAPFFFIGHLFAKLLHYKQDGFSAPYQLSVLLGCILYTIAGIGFLIKVLRYFFKERLVIIVLLLIVFSTNFIVHVTMYGQNTMSHALLFFTYAAILWFTIQWHQQYKIRHIIALALCIGITIVARPSEIVCILIPLLWNIQNRKSVFEKWQTISAQWKQFLLAFIIVILAILPQLLYWKTQTNHWFFDSYANNFGEGFEFLKPYVWQVLFSFRKGWLVYTPIMLIAILGFYQLQKQNAPIFYALFIYFIINLYIVSSWSCWWYAQSFSQRALIPSYPVMAIPLGYFIQWIYTKSKAYKIIFALFATAFLSLNIIQTIQFHYGIINGDRMTAAYYKKVFLKFQKNEKDEELLLVNRSFAGPTKFTNEANYQKRDLEIINFEQQYGTDTGFAFEGKCSFKLDSNHIYTPVIETKFKQLTLKDHAWLRAKVMVYLPATIKQAKFSVVFHFENRGNAYGFAGFDSEYMTLKAGQWNAIEADYLTPEVRSVNDKLKVYLYQRGKEEVYVDNFMVEVMEQK